MYACINVVLPAAANSSTAIDSVGAMPASVFSLCFPVALDSCKGTRQTQSEQ